jgi:hypothetical protein|tara:strand:+ start:408 stop:653 length:246 start_codon:yes stop_codon:yes gene_type:complete
MTLKTDMIDALRTKYESEYKQAKVTLDVYLNNSVGIGEHPQHFEEMDKLVDTMAAAQDKLDVLKKEHSKEIFLKEKVEINN